MSTYTYYSGLGSKGMYVKPVSDLFSVNLRQYRGKSLFGYPIKGFIVSVTNYEFFNSLKLYLNQLARQNKTNIELSIIIDFDDPNLTKETNENQFTFEQDLHDSQMLLKRSLRAVFDLFNSPFFCGNVVVKLTNEINLYPFCIFVLNLKGIAYNLVDLTLDVNLKTKVDQENLSLFIQNGEIVIFNNNIIYIENRLYDFFLNYLMALNDIIIEQKFKSINLVFANLSAMFEVYIQDQNRYMNFNYFLYGLIKSQCLNDFRNDAGCLGLIQQFIVIKPAALNIMEIRLADKVVVSGTDCLRNLISYYTKCIYSLSNKADNLLPSELIIKILGFLVVNEQLNRFAICNDDKPLIPGIEKQIRYIRNNKNILSHIKSKFLGKVYFLVNILLVVFLGLSYLGVLNLLSFNCTVIIQNFYNCFKDDLLFLFLVIISILYSCFFLINPVIALTSFNMFYKEFCLLYTLDLFLPVAGRLYECISPQDLNFIVPEKKVPIWDSENSDVSPKNLNRI